MSNIFSRTMIQNTPPRRPYNCFETITYNFYYGQYSFQTLIILNTFGNMSNVNFPSIKSHLEEYMNCGIDWLMSGMELHQKYVKTQNFTLPHGSLWIPSPFLVHSCSSSSFPGVLVYSYIIPAPFLHHSCSIPTSFLLHSYIIPAPFLHHFCSIPTSFLVHS